MAKKPRPARVARPSRSVSPVRTPGGGRVPVAPPPETEGIPIVVELPKAGEPLRDVELQRRARRLAARREVQSRIDEYFDALDQADRSAKPAAMVRRPARARGPATRQLRIIAEGDSWFDYPWFLLRHGGIIPRLNSRLGDVLAAGTILNLAHHGDEVRQMLGVTQRNDLIRCLRKSRFDAILFSGGGNDIVGDQFALWLKTRADNGHASAALRDEIFRSVLNVVMAGFDDLVALRDEHAAGAVIFVHAYSVPYPQDKGVCGVGPWLYPALHHRGWTDPADHRIVAQTMLNTFGAMLRQWASRQRDVVYVDTLALDIGLENWHNEIHPDSDGFNLVADSFAQAIRVRFGL